MKNNLENTITYFYYFEKINQPNYFSQMVFGLIVNFAKSCVITVNLAIYVKVSFRDRQLFLNY